jgi:hypothetical protein
VTGIDLSYLECLTLVDGKIACIKLAIQLVTLLEMSYQELWTGFPPSAIMEQRLVVNKRRYNSSHKIWHPALNIVYYLLENNINYYYYYF